MARSFLRLLLTLGSLLLSLVLLMELPLAQVRMLEKDEGFSEDSLRISFGGSLKDLFALWGVSFHAAGEGSAVAIDGNALFPINIATPPPFPLLSNEPPPGGSSAGLPLIIDAAFPMKRFGLTLVNPGSEGVNAEVRVFDRAGNLMGVFAGIAVPPVATQRGALVSVGFESLSPDAIAKVTVDYGGSEAPEMVYAAVLDFLSRPKFQSGLAQIGRGPLPRGGRLETSISIVNLSASTAQGQIRFYDGGGQLIPLAEKGVTPLSLPPFGTQFLETADFGLEAFSGYAWIDSNVPLATSALYRALDSDGIMISEAGIAGDAPGTYLVGFGEEQRRAATSAPGTKLNELYTAFAVANPSDEPTWVNLSWGSNNRTINLAPGEHRAAFLGDFLFLPAGLDEKRPLIIRSFRPVIATTLQTRQGLPEASLPMAAASR